MQYLNLQHPDPALDRITLFAYFIRNNSSFKYNFETDVPANFIPTPIVNGLISLFLVVIPVRKNAGLFR